MTHSILAKKHLGNGNWHVRVLLKPDNDAEAKAIQNTASVTASETEREFVDNYLNFYLELGDYSVVSLIGQLEKVFALYVYIG